MSLSPQTLSALQALLAQDPALLVRVQAAPDAAQAAILMTETATKNGIAISAVELQTYFAEVNQAAAGQALSDAQLEAVAGGWSNRDTFITMSVLTLGTGCAYCSLSEVAYSVKKAFCEL